VENRAIQNTAKSQLISDAIEKDNLERVKKLINIELHQIPNTKDLLPIYKAAWERKWNILEFLLSNLEKSFSIESTPDKLIAHLGYALLDYIDNHLTPAPEMVKRFLNAGADLDNQFCLSKKGLLHVAAGRGLLEITKILLEAGCNINALDKDNHLPLYLAYDAGHEVCGEMLANYQRNKMMDMLLFSLILISDCNSKIYSLFAVPDVFFKIYEYGKNIFNDTEKKNGQKTRTLYTKNDFLLFEILNVLMAKLNTVHAKLTLHSAECAINESEKNNHSTKSLALFTFLKNTTNDKFMSLTAKAEAINDKVDTFVRYSNEKTHNQGAKSILKKYHLFSTACYRIEAMRQEKNYKAKQILLKEQEVKVIKIAKQEIPYVPDYRKK